MKHRTLLRKLCALLLTGAVCAVQLSALAVKADPVDLGVKSVSDWEAEVWVGGEMKSRYLNFESAWSQAAELSSSLRKEANTNVIKRWNMAEDLIQFAAKDYTVTVKLLQDWKVDGSFPDSISEGGAVNLQNCSIVLDLNGHVVSRGLIKKQDNGQLFTVKSNAEFTVCDSDPTASNYGYGVRGGILTGGYSDDYSGCIEIKSGGTFNFTGGSIVSCHSDKAGAAVRMADGGNLNVSGGSFYFNTETNDGGGAIYAKKGTVNLKNAVFEANSTTDDGGAIRLDNTKLKAIDCIFRGNKSEDNGGGVYITGGDSEADFNGCVFIGNDADDDGGGAYVNKCDYAFFRNSLFDGNSAGDTGGAVHADYDNAVLDSVTIIGNKAENGGGAYVYSKKDIAVQGRVIIRDNHDKDGNANNLVLGYSSALFGSSKAYVNNGGLYEGSEIHVKANTGGTTKIGNNISVSQRQYFIADGGSLKMEKLEKRSEKFVSSVIGEGSLVIILIGLMTVIIAVIGIHIYRKHSGKATKEEEA